MTLRLTEYKLILKIYADCLGRLLALAKQKWKTKQMKNPNPWHVAHMVIDSSLGPCDPNTKWLS